MYLIFKILVGGRANDIFAVLAIFYLKKSAMQIYIEALAIIKCKIITMEIILIT